MGGRPLGGVVAGGTHQRQKYQISLYRRYVFDHACLCTCTGAVTGITSSATLPRVEIGLSSSGKKKKRRKTFPSSEIEQNVVFKWGVCGTGADTTVRRVLLQTYQVMYTNKIAVL